MVSLFRGRSSPPPSQRLEQELRALEQRAAAASPGYETQFLNRAGGLCVEAGQPDRALGYYGRAIDAYLESGRFSAAEVLCRKVLQVSPGAVRARCTLAWLALGKGHHDSVEREIVDYVRAAREAGMESLAARQLAMMAAAAPAMELRAAIGEHLLDLGAFTEADRVLAAVHREQSGERPPPSEDEGRLWSQLLHAALMGPDEIREQRYGPAGEESGAPPGRREEP